MALSIVKDVAYDNRIVEWEYHTHLPFGSGKVGPADEVRFVIQHQDLITATYDSFIYVEAALVPDDAAKTYELTNNPVAFLFDEIRYDLGDQTIETVRNPGITTTLKGLASLSPQETKYLDIAGWSPTADKLSIATRNAADQIDGFAAIVPLRFFLGFAEDYRKVIPHMKQALTLRRARTDAHCYVGTAAVKIDIQKIEWRVPYLKLSDAEKLKLLRNLEKDGLVRVPFRKWDLYHVPGVRNSKVELVNLSCTTQFSKPRYVIIGFQTAKENSTAANNSVFDPLDIVNVSVFLNEKRFPYVKWNLDRSKNRYLLAYKAYCDFQKSYYDKLVSEPLLTYDQYKLNPLFVIDCSKQQDDVKSGTVDMKTEFEAAISFPANTYAYVLVIHDALVTYQPLTNLVIHQQL